MYSLVKDILRFPWKLLVYLDVFVDGFARLELVRVARVVLVSLGVLAMCGLSAQFAFSFDWPSSGGGAGGSGSGGSATSDATGPSASAPHASESDPAGPPKRPVEIEVIADRQHYFINIYSPASRDKAERHSAENETQLESNLTSMIEKCDVRLVTLTVTASYSTMPPEQLRLRLSKLGFDIRYDVNADR